MFQTGLDASVFAGGYTQGASNGTAAWGSAQGPAQTATTAAFGTTADPGGGVSRVTKGVLSAGTIALVGLVLVWMSLPR